ncbi:MAG TPA: NHL repeat-containing protein, partial [Coriobacteriia bacterium]
MSDVSTERDEERGWRELERRRVKRTRRTLIVVLVVLIILLLIGSFALVAIFQPAGQVATSQEAAGITWVRSIYGWGKGTANQFTGPQGVGIGPDGTIWATTQGQNRVVGFNPDGSLASMLYQGPNTTPPSQTAFTFPVAAAVDPAGLVYIADQTRSTVWVVNRNNHVVRTIFVPTPSAIAVSADRLVVGSASGFVVMTPAGSVIKVIGKQGKGIDQFQGVRGLAIAKDGTIYVVDQYNNRLSAYDHSGNRKWIISLGNPGNQKPIGQSMVEATSTAPANMQIPAGMTIDGAGRLVITDPFGFDFVVLRARDGKLIAKYGAAGTLDGQFIYPSSIAYDPLHDWFAVADTQNARVQIIRIPNSGGSVVAATRATLSGPLRACLIPLALLLLVLLIGLIYRQVSRRKKRRALAAGQAPE